MRKNIKIYPNNKKIKLLIYSHIHILITKKNIIIKANTILYSSHYFLKNTLFSYTSRGMGFIDTPITLCYDWLEVIYMQLIYSSL